MSLAEVPFEKRKLRTVDQVGALSENERTVLGAALQLKRQNNLNTLDGVNHTPCHFTKTLPFMASGKTDYESAVCRIHRNFLGSLVVIVSRLLPLVIGWPAHEAALRSLSHARSAPCH